MDKFFKLMGSIKILGKMKKKNLQKRGQLTRARVEMCYDFEKPETARPLTFFAPISSRFCNNLVVA